MMCTRALTLLLVLVGAVASTSAAAYKPSKKYQDAEFVIPADLIDGLASYRATALDACAMADGFKAKKFADVKAIYENGKFAVRDNGRVRIPKGVCEREYTDEQHYIDGLEYGFPASYWDKLFVGPAVNGTAPYDEDDKTRAAAGSSWSRMYQVLYVAHEVDAALANAREGAKLDNATYWEDAVVEVQDAYSVYLGEGKCSLKKWFEKTSPRNARKLIKAFNAFRDGANAQDLEDVEHARQDVFDAISAILLQLTIDTIGYRASSKNKAAALPFVKAMVAHWAPNSSDEAEDLIEILEDSEDDDDHYRRSSKSYEARYIRRIIYEIAYDNGYRL